MDTNTESKEVEVVEVDAEVAPYFESVPGAAGRWPGDTPQELATDIGQRFFDVADAVYILGSTIGPAIATVMEGVELIEGAISGESADDEGEQSDDADADA